MLRLMRSWIMSSYRDLTQLPLDKVNDLVIACDSSAGIGKKADDQVTIASSVMAAFTIRVPLLEFICHGVTPLAAVDTVGNEMYPTGQAVIQGIRDELTHAGFAGLSLNGSTEDNMTTQTTSVGVTLIGKLAHSDLVPATPEPLHVFQLGRPLVGDAVVAHINDIFSYDQVKAIRRFVGVQDMLPVGSKGIAYEVNQIAKTQQHPRLTWSVGVDQQQLTTSAGPATVVIVAVRESRRLPFTDRFPELLEIGRLEV